MDEHESIPRREALAGLGVLSALALALVGTIVFRIVRSSPHHGAPQPVSDWASESRVNPGTSELPPISEPAAIVGHETEPARFPATPIPVASESSLNIPAASTAESMPSAQTSGPPLPTVRPRFVAPAGR